MPASVDGGPSPGAPSKPIGGPSLSPPSSPGPAPGENTSSQPVTVRIVRIVPKTIASRTPRWCHTMPVARASNWHALATSARGLYSPPRHGHTPACCRRTRGRLLRDGAHRSVVGGAGRDVGGVLHVRRLHDVGAVAGEVL